MLSELRAPATSQASLALRLHGERARDMLKRNAA
jgi:hypothetical protein